MAHFRGAIKGNRGEASRLGTKKSGLTARLNGWDIGADVFLEYSEERGCDILAVYVTRGSSYNNSDRIVVGEFAVVNDILQKI